MGKVPGELSTNLIIKRANQANHFSQPCNVLYCRIFKIDRLILIRGKSNKKYMYADNLSKITDDLSDGWITQKFVYVKGVG